MLNQNKRETKLIQIKLQIMMSLKKKKKITIKIYLINMKLRLQTFVDLMSGGHTDVCLVRIART